MSRPEPRRSTQSWGVATLAIIAAVLLALSGCAISGTSGLGSATSSPSTGIPGDPASVTPSGSSTASPTGASTTSATATKAPTVATATKAPTVATATKAPTTPATATPTHVPQQPAIQKVFRSLTLQGGESGPVAVPCPGGEHALGGGWATQTGLDKVTATMLSGNGWSLIVLPAAYVGSVSTNPLTIFVECLANTPGAVVTQREVDATVAPNASHAINASCQSGETVVGGGYDFSFSSEYLEASMDQPQTSGVAAWWTVKVTNKDAAREHDFNVYVECLSHVNITTPTYPSQQGGYVYVGSTDTVEVGCPSGARLAGGGFSYTGNSIGDIVFSFPAGSLWRVVIYGVTGSGLIPLVATSWAVCLTFP